MCFFSSSLFSFQKYRKTLNTLLNIIIISTKNRIEDKSQSIEYTGPYYSKRKSFFFIVDSFNQFINLQCQRVEEDCEEFFFLLLRLILIFIAIRHRKKKTRKNMLELVLSLLLQKSQENKSMINFFQTVFMSDEKLSIKYMYLIIDLIYQMNWSKKQKTKVRSFLIVINH